ncbi:MAG: sigma-70 family RNA polymerase sigma factor [Dehalococcoidia bacterium]|jgi:RNA polymerase sigma-70 factor (ECF subfamily)|nr:sigma-70 family RNA polymerase sigma factor [Dehalococcoidia bacterium]
MAKINLREYYYWYTEDTFVEVSDEVSIALGADKKYEKNHARRMRRNKTYSLEAEVDIETTDFSEPIDDPQMYLEWKEKMCSLCRALNSLSDIQGRRIEAHFLLNKKRKEIAESEGVAKSVLNRSIERGLQKMKMFLKNPKNRGVKCSTSVP